MKNKIFDVPKQGSFDEAALFWLTKFAKRYVHPSHRRFVETTPEGSFVLRIQHGEYEHESRTITAPTLVELCRTVETSLPSLKVKHLSART